ncbi:DsbE family thiol:disulfide interchange protein [Pseudoruegeria sp. SK021]|uniref:DsbE family thiol:disulfide interchange protein n=1 Tax=Pseudoruegeria sp. SK021 TaxID=1933035 RepID=UPI000A25FB01|nr:DsbE family thiol:disulfide interchange protein [Pseudoruegeria sp. SK021]OSP56273.1 thiol:disulfide interchange protein [Pseudoruegeria sp. SK021]
MAKISPLMILPPLIFAGLAGLFYVGMFRDDPDGLPSTMEGRAVPPVVVVPLADLPVFDDATLRSDGVKLVNYWASWCAPCRAEHPSLELLAAEGVPIYGVNYKDDPEKALAFLAELGDPYTAIGADSSGRMGVNWGLYGVPETFVIDADGIVRLRFAGPITARILDEKIRPAIAAAAEPN